MAYDRLEPIGDRRLDLLATHLAYNAYLVSGNANKDHPAPITDFMPKWVQDEEDDGEAAADQLRAKASAAFGALKGRR
jgi:hypothetical protein